jgi:hypothetical protein
MSKQTETPRQLGGELVIPVLAVGFTLYYFSTIWNSPWTAQVSAFLVGGVLLLVCALFFVRAAQMLARGEGSLGAANLVGMDDIRSGRLGLFVCTLGFCWFIDDLGFTLATFLFLALSMGILSRGRNLPLIAGVSALMALGGWALFIWAFDTRFPRGVFEEVMAGLLSNG